ncbi:hypothetical protein VNO78_09055 [Psophocarpus tetragonolobus]|uniref:Rx N-terminal domain-containing protein n=1 Tax=Psophocarpus tetragonolobus TaxID=3891 RepID=A0AAN9SW07_PSOTE
MAEFVLESVIGNLNSLVQKELGLLLGFDQDLERLGSLFSTIKATLEDAEEKQFSNRSIKDWLGKLKDAAHILDDIIDECGYETLGLEYQSDKVQCSCLSSFHPKHVVFRYKIVKKMQRISERLKEIASERTGFHLDVMVPERSGVIERPQTTSSLSEPQVYGRKENKKQIVQFLVADASHFEDLSVYPIVGLEDVCCVTDDNFVSILSEKIHHLSDNRRSRSSSEEANSIQLHKVKSLRTHISPYHHKTAKLSTHVLKCYSLRVLHCQPINELSSSIDHLKHLRYLNLSQGEFTTLPESLCKLWNLHILKLDNCYRLQRLPNSLIFLKALQQLSLNGCDSLLSLPPHIRKLTSLTRLTTYFIGYKRGLHLAELGALKLKGDLHIRHMGKVKSIMDAKDANMSSKQLNKLWLSWDRNEESKLQENVKEILEELKPDTQQLECLGVKGYKGVHFPQWMSSPSLKCLTDLKLEDCENCSQLPLLGKLPSLKKLRIDNMIYLKYLYEECYDGGVDFKALESLILVYLPSLIRLSRNDEENIFPQLSSLQIIECPKLLKVSRGFQFLTHLKELSIKSCREVEGLHTALQNMTSLRSLYLRDLPMLEFLPDCFGNLPLLHELTIWKCSKLKCLPTSLSLSSLEWLHIYDCPELEKRCESKTGEDWPKIAHIPHRRIGAQYART